MTGQKLRLLREFRNYSQEYIAEKLGITQHAYSRLENNQTKMTADRLENEIRALHKDRDRIIHLVEKLTGMSVATTA